MAVHSLTSPRPAASAGKGRSVSASHSPCARVAVAPAAEKKVSKMQLYRPPPMRDVASRALAPALPSPQRQMAAPSPRPRLPPAESPRGSSSSTQRTAQTPTRRSGGGSSPLKADNTTNPPRPVQRPPTTLLPLPKLYSALRWPPASPSPPSQKDGSTVPAKKVSKKVVLTDSAVPYFNTLEDLSTLNLSVAPPGALPLGSGRAKKIAMKKQAMKIEIGCQRTRKYKYLGEDEEEEDGLYY